MVTAGPIHAFLAGIGKDGSGRRLHDVLEFDDARIEGVHDFIQWCFPLREASRAVPDAPVLSDFEADAIRADILGRSGVLMAMARMTRFYCDTKGWLRAYDHNHLRITRIIASVRELVGPDEAAVFYDLVVELNRKAGSPINADSLAFWKRALHPDTSMLASGRRPG